MARWTRAWLAMVSTLAIGLVMATPARAAAGDPSGNNGTIKVDGRPFDDAPDNEPHPGCVFQIDFYGFDAGDLNADLTFEAVAPTAGGVLLTDTVPIGEDSHAGGGSEKGLDASRTYDLTSELSGIAPQRNQGWHVRLTVHADGSQGSDVKHKVFWVDDCATNGADTAPASGDTGGTSATRDTTAPEAPSTGAVGSETQMPSTPAAPSASPGGAVLSAELVAPAAESPAAAAAPMAPTALPAEVLGETVTRAAPASPATASGASALARTGIGLGLAVLALLLVGAGLLLRSLTAPRLRIRS